MRLRRMMGLTFLCGVAILAVAYVALSFASQRRLDEAVARLDASAPQTTAGADSSRTGETVPPGDETRSTSGGDGWQKLCVELPAGFDALRHELYVPNDGDEDTWKQLRSTLEPVDDYIDRIRQAALEGGPVFSGEARYPSQDNSRIPHVWVRLLECDAALAFHDGDINRGAADLMALLQLGDSLSMEPLLIGSIFSERAYRSVIRTLESLPPESMEPSRESQLMDLLARGADRERFAVSLRGEASNVANQLTNPQTISPWDAYGDGSARSYFTGIANRAHASALARPWVAADTARFVDSMVALADASERPYLEGAPLVSAIVEDYSSWLYPISLLGASSMPELLESFTGYEASLGLARVGLAIERYRAANGAYPESLEDVAESIPGGLPMDPFTGHNFHYVVSDDGFRLYSVGVDGQDNGGEPIRDGEDIVWRAEEDESVISSTYVGYVDEDGEYVELGFEE